MKDVFRIMDRFLITGRGSIYILKICCPRTDIRMGDILYDLCGNRFKVTGVEMIRRIPGTDYDETERGYLFEKLDGIEAIGNLLVKSLKKISFLFCSNPLFPQRPLEDYKEEYRIACLEHDCALFSYEGLKTGQLLLNGENISGLTVYRGWKMTSELYKAFFDMLEARGIILINTPEEYETYHMLPRWYDDFRDITSYSVWENQGTVDSALLLAKDLYGPYIVKDYVKSRKYEWYVSCFIYNIAIEATAKRIIGNFIERQGSDMIGGVVLRQVEKLKPIGFHEKSGMPISEEYRVFAFAGRIMLIDDYWRADRKICFTDEEYCWIEKAVKRIKSNFVSMDIARRQDGSLIVIELEDGQVSGLRQINPVDFYKAFFHNASE